MSSWRPEIDVILTDSEDEENEAIQLDFKGREALLFVVDANLYADKTRFSSALEIIRGAFISGLLVNDKDLMGVMFANTAKSPEPFEPNCLDIISVPEDCAVFLPLRQLTKPIVEHFLSFLMTAAKKFDDSYGIVGNGGCGKFANMLRLCVNLFENCGYSLNNATIVYLTDRETPHPIQSHGYQVALQKAKDLDGKEIEFHVIPMLDEFNYDVFYKEFLTLVRDVELDSFVASDPQQLREYLTDRKLKQDFLKRCLGHFNFSLGPNLEISVQYYNYFQRRSYPHKVKLLRKDNTIVKQKHVIVVRKQHSETLEFTDEREVKMSGGWYEIQLGDMPIRITTEQMIRVRNLHTRGMMLLGFKPKSSLPPNMYYKPNNFMYADDQSISGSKRLFRALWQRCMDRDKVAICLFMRKMRSIPRYVALVPVARANAEHDRINFRSLLSGDGFKIIVLPMAKHLRHVDFTNWNSIENSAPSEGVEIFDKVIKKLRIKYQPNLINDPTLELLQANLLALGLNIKTENGGLTNMPDASMQDDRIAPVLGNFSEIFGSDIEPAKKRTAKPPSEANAAKVPKATEDNIKQFDYVEQLIANKTLASCTIPQLRYILEEHYGVKMPKTTKKDDLIEKIYSC